MFFPCDENSWDLLWTTFILTYSNVNYISHVVHYIPGAYLSYKWKFVPSDHRHPAPPPPHPPATFW